MNLGPRSEDGAGSQGEGAREAVLAEASVLMGQQAPGSHIRCDPMRGVRPGEACADIGPEAGLRVAAVLAYPDLEARHERTAALRLDPAPRPFETEADPCDLRLRGREASARASTHLVGRGLYNHRVRGRRELEPAVGGRPHHHAAPAHGCHAEVHVGLDRRLALRRQRERARAVAHNAP